MHLRVKLLSWWAWVIRPRHIVLPKVVGAVFCVPFIIAARPWKSAAEWWVEVEQGPRDDGVVVEGDVQGDDADGKTDAWEKPKETTWSTSMTWAGLCVFAHLSDRRILVFINLSCMLPGICYKSPNIGCPVITLSFYHTLPLLLIMIFVLFRPWKKHWTWKIEGFFCSFVFLPLNIGQMCFHMEMAPVRWNWPRANSM